jgi:hypothetical protein
MIADMGDGLANNCAGFKVSDLNHPKLHGVTFNNLLDSGSVFSFRNMSKHSLEQIVETFRVSKSCDRILVSGGVGFFEGAKLVDNAGDCPHICLLLIVAIFSLIVFLRISDFWAEVVKRADSGVTDAELIPLLFGASKISNFKYEFFGFREFFFQENISWFEVSMGQAYGFIVFGFMNISYWLTNLNENMPDCFLRNLFLFLLKLLDKLGQVTSSAQFHNDYDSVFESDIVVRHISDNSIMVEIV